MRMESSEKEGLARLYDEFAIRHPETGWSKSMPVNLNLDKKAVAEVVQSNIKSIVDGYDTIQKGDTNNVKKTNEFGDYETRAFWSAHVSERPISLAATKMFKTFKEYWLSHVPGDEVERILLELFLENQNTPIAAVTLEKKSANEWALDHRYVDEKYRGQKIASMLLEAAETFARQYGEKTGVPQKISINVGQPHLMEIFQAKGYQPAEEQDKRNAERIFSGDETLELDYAITESGDAQTDIEPYVFEKGTVAKRPVNALRIILEKTIAPEKTRVAEMTGEIAKKIRGV